MPSPTRTTGRSSVLSRWRHSSTDWPAMHPRCALCCSGTSLRSGDADAEPNCARRTRPHSRGDYCDPCGAGRAGDGPGDRAGHGLSGLRTVKRVVGGATGVPHAGADVPGRSDEGPEPALGARVPAERRHAHHGTWRPAPDRPGRRAGSGAARRHPGGVHAAPQGADGHRAPSPLRAEPVRLLHLPQGESQTPVGGHDGPGARQVRGARSAGRGAGPVRGGRRLHGRGADLADPVRSGRNAVHGGRPAGPLRGGLVRLRTGPDQPRRQDAAAE